MMSNLLQQAIQNHATHMPQQLAIVGASHSLRYAELPAAITQAQAWLATSNIIALAMDNSPAWAVLDLAVMQNAPSQALVPIPYFFSASQILHSLNNAGVDTIITDQAAKILSLLDAASIALLQQDEIHIAGSPLTVLRIQANPSARLPAGTAKITYTSGTTGNPKGVCLGLDSILQVAQSLAVATQGQPQDRHLSLLPLSTLLENIAGLYVPLLAGASTQLLSAEQVGLTGASGVDIGKMLHAISAAQASTLILTPELLRGLIMALEAGLPKPQHLRFIAVGGASVAPRLLQRAHALDLAVFEGYGLSECASVVSLNTEQDYRIGSVGKVLPHKQIQIAADGEIMVYGTNFLGYSQTDKQPEQAQDYVATGDIGHIDADGFLYITGRKKNIFISSFGRNVSPEWVERELNVAACISQSAVFGEAQPYNVALIVPSQQNVANPQAIELAISYANQQLPDYAQIRKWLIVEQKFTPQNGQLTVNGRLKREAIWQNYAQQINVLYKDA